MLRNPVNVLDDAKALMAWYERLRADRQNVESRWQEFKLGL